MNNTTFNMKCYILIIQFFFSIQQTFAMLVFGIVAYDAVKKYFTGSDSKPHISFNSIL